MREIVRRCTPGMTPPDASQRAEAALLWGRRETHDRFMAEWPCLSQVELQQPPEAPPPDSFIVTAWNIERCKQVEDSADRLAGAGADIVLATEMDLGMAGRASATPPATSPVRWGWAMPSASSSWNSALATPTKPRNIAVRPTSTACTAMPSCRAGR